MSVPSLEFLIDAKTPLANTLQKWDLFISAYNDSPRVKQIFGLVPASKKVWWLLPEYAYSADESPKFENVVSIPPSNEAEVVQRGFSGITLAGTSLKVCIDITGFMRPHILYLLKYLLVNEVRSFDMIYTEPAHYSRRADTRFSLDEVTSVRQVAGFEGQHSPEMSHDVLIVGVGYDDKLVAHAIRSKENARLVQLHSLPSLSADMYHESILRLDRVSGISPKRTDGQVFFSSANDPFVTATSLAEAYVALNDRRAITNLYLCPLATKPQTLGFGLFHLRNSSTDAASIIFPFSGRYSRETSAGVGRTWVYPIEL